MYVTPDEFLKFSSNTTFSNSLSALHINCRSLPKHYEDVHSLLLSLNYSIDVLALSETWLDGNVSSDICFTGYNMENNARKDRKGGGVSIAIKNHLKYKMRNDISAFNDSCENIFIEILKPGKILL